MSKIEPVLLPSWGLTMEEGTLVRWLADPGAFLVPGDEIAEIETTKIANVLEAQVGGILRRHVAKPGETYACGTLIGVIADGNVSEADIDAFIAGHQVIAKTIEIEVIQKNVTLGDHRLSYVEEGAGDAVPILFIHGLAGSSNNWTLVQGELGAGRRTLAVDLPGHGASSKGIAMLNSFPEVADIVSQFLNALDAPRVHVVAHSMGAQIALAMARSAPEQISSLTLIAPAGVGRSADPEFLNRLISAKSRRDVAAVLDQLMTKGNSSRELADEMLRYMRLDGVKDALSAYAKWLSTATLSPTEAFAGLSQPHLAIWGTEDRVVQPPADGEWPNGIAPILLPGTGHMPHLESHKLVLDVIGRLLEQLG